ncbi:SRPBCC family protein [Actinocorallia longicatena]|uniref:SRPBCC family protein n=1 Tax=Actinocorallia longicatena TaxID=111803 RepID=A0ABP6QDZ9_9ACTN
MIDVTHQISAVSRTVGSRTLEAGEARVITVSRVYPTSQDDLWEACTSAERIPRWFLPISGDLKEGGRFQFENHAGGLIESCDRPHRIEATWEFGGEISWITLTLVPVEEDHTRFQLEHVAHVDDERWAEFGPGAVGIGWDSGFLGLALHLTDGTFNAADMMPWTVSPEGVSFMTQAGEAWYAADVASGRDPSAARAAADRCIAAYTATG